MSREQRPRLAAGEVVNPIIAQLDQHREDV